MHFLKFKSFAYYYKDYKKMLEMNKSFFSKITGFTLILLRNILTKVMPPWPQFNCRDKVWKLFKFEMSQQSY